MCGPLLIPGKTKKYRELIGNQLVQDDRDIEILKKKFMAVIMEPFNALAANIGVLETIKYLTNYSECNLISKIYRMNLVSLRSEILNLDKEQNHSPNYIGRGELTYEV
ncbi:hypothetical protein D3C78_1778700 [compost metagenome]